MKIAIFEDSLDFMSVSKPIQAVADYMKFITNQAIGVITISGFFQAICRAYDCRSININTNSNFHEYIGRFFGFHLILRISSIKCFASSSSS